MKDGSDATFAIRPRREDAAAVVAVSGFLDMVTAPRLASELDAILHEQPTVLVIDLTMLTFLASAGIEVLVAVQRLSATIDTAVRIVAREHHIVHPIEVLGLGEFLRMHTTVDAALADATP